MNSQKMLFLLLIFIGCSAQIASDIYAPSLPAIAQSLHVSIAEVQFSMAIYMLGLALSQLIYGPLSEGLGRKIPLLIGLSILFLGDLISLFAPTIQLLIIGRLVQGCGAGACSALWRSIFRDRFQGDELAKYGSYFSIFVTFIVPAAPVLGGYLQEYMHWRANFAFLALYALATLLMVLIGFKETSQYHQLERLKPQYIIHAYKHIFSNRIFMGYTACTFLCYGAFFSWFAVGPVLLIHNVGISPIAFGWLTLFGGGLATALGGFVNGKWVMRFGRHRMLRIGFTIMFIAGVSLIFFPYLWGMQILTIILPMVLFYFGVSFIWPNAFAGAFGPFGSMAGYAGALYGFMQISGASVMGMLVSYLPHQNPMPLALVFMCTALFASLIFETIVRKREKACL